MCAGLYTTTVRSAATVMRQWSFIDNLGNLDAGTVDGADSTLATLTRTLHIDLNLTQSHVESNLGAIGGCRLCCIRSVLLRTAETHLTCRRPADNLADLVGDGNDNVVESRVDKCHAGIADLNDLLLDCSCFLCHNSPVLLGCLFLVCDRLLLSFAGTGIVFGALTANRKTDTVADTAIAADIHQSLDIQLSE